MGLVDLIVAIVVVTILVTVVVGVATYVAYKFRIAREPGPGDESDGPRYFVVHRPPEDDSPGDDEARTRETGSGDREG